jgi:hypothetical protein
MPLNTEAKSDEKSRKQNKLQNTIEKLLHRQEEMEANFTAYLRAEHDNCNEARKCKHDVHGLNCAERRKYLQESKLRPRVMAIGHGDRQEANSDCQRYQVIYEQILSSARFNNAPSSILYRYSIPRKHSKESYRITKLKKSKLHIPDQNVSHV